MLSKVSTSRCQGFVETDVLADSADTSSLNAGAVREEASIIVHRSPIKPNRGRRRSLSTTSSSSSDSRRDPSRRLLIVTGSTRAGMKLSSKQVIADLSRELERVRRDGESLLRERDDQVSVPWRSWSSFVERGRLQIDRLQHERQLRKTELKDVYLSFDTLLGLGGAVELSANAAPPTDDTTPRHKAVRTKSGRSARLKAEIQEMEQEVSFGTILLNEREADRARLSGCSIAAAKDGSGRTAAAQLELTDSRNRHRTASSRTARRTARARYAEESIVRLDESRM